MERKERALMGFVARIFIILAPVLLMFVSQAWAGNVGVHVGIDLPLPGVYVAPAPVYVAPPAVVVRPAPVVVRPAPVVIERRHVVYEEDYPRPVKYRHGHPKWEKKHPKCVRYYDD